MSGEKRKRKIGETVSRDIDARSENGDCEVAEVAEVKKRRTRYKSTLSYGRKGRKVDTSRGKFKTAKTNSGLTKMQRRADILSIVKTTENKQGSSTVEETENKKGSSLLRNEINYRISYEEDVIAQNEIGDNELYSEINISNVLKDTKCEMPQESGNNNCNENMTNEDITNEDILNGYFETCKEALMDKKTLQSLCEILHKADVLNDFVVLFCSLANGTFDPLNISFLMCLEKCKFDTLKTTTTQMRYRDKTKLFWKILYKETSGKAIRLASGQKNKGTVVQHETKRGHYDPKEAMTNFAVPDIRLIAESDPLKTGLVTEIQPGLIPRSMELLEGNSDIVLMGDGKGLARGQLPGGKGDVDLFGHEEGPTKHQLQRFIDNIQATVDAVRDDLSLESVRKLLSDSSSLLKELTVRSQYFHKRRQGIFKRYQKENNEKAFSAGMSWVNGMDYKIRSAIEKFLDMNGHISSVLSHMQGNHDSFLAGDGTSIAEISNLKLLKEPDEIEHDYDLNSNAMQLVKPGTELWSKLRHEAYVTADTVFNAIGLKTNDAMKNHYNNFVKHTTKKQDFIPEECLEPASSELLGFVASKLATSLFDNATIEQTGVYFQDSSNCERFMAATPDCILHHAGKKVPVVFETKDAISMPSKESLCRALCEMHVLDSDCALHISILKGYIVTHSIEMIPNLAREIMEVAVGIYDKQPEDVTMPPKLIVAWKDNILTKLEEMSENHCFEGVTLPFAATSFWNASQTDEKTGPYAWRVSKKINDINCCFLDSTMKYILDVCDNTLVEAHTLLRPQSDEIFAIMATDTDRISKPHIPAQVPVAYGLKGGGLSTHTLRSMMDEVKDELHSRNLKVVCEVFDGYHHTYMERAADGSPLYRTRLQLDTWNKVNHLGKAALIGKIENLSSVKIDLPYLEQHHRMHSEWKIEGNIYIVHTKKQVACPRSKRQHGIFLLSSRGGPLKTIGILQNLHSTTGWFAAEQSSWIDFSRETIADFLLAPEQLQGYSKHERVKLALLHEEPSFLKKMVLALQRAAPTKRIKLNPAKLLEILQDANKLQKALILTEITLVDEMVACTAQKKLLPKFSTNKERKCSVIALVFGGSGVVSKMCLHPLSLCEQSKAVLMSQDYPIMQLKVAVAEVYHIHAKSQWFALSSVPLHVIVNDEGKEVELFSYPEYNHLRNKVEPKVTDPYHILTNLRKGATSGAYPELCDKDAWKRVVRSDRKLLTTSIVEDNVDKQNGALARRVFSVEVQKIMEENGDLKTAQFVHHVRNFFNACDKRGLTAAERITYLVEMQEFLCSGLSFDTFPPPTTRIRSIPIVTFEAIMANIATRIQLYSICSQETYNHRAISSLAVENFFSTLASTSRTGCPRATDIPRVIGQLVALNHYKHLDTTELGFHYQTASKVAYDIHTLDKISVSNENVHVNTSMWKNHHFDTTKSTAKRYDKGSVTHDLKPLKGVRAVRASFYKIDEQKLDTLRRMGVDSEDLLRFGIPLEWKNDEE